MGFSDTLQVTHLLEDLTPGGLHLHKRWVWVCACECVRVHTWKSMSSGTFGPAVP